MGYRKRRDMGLNEKSIPSLEELAATPTHARLPNKITRTLTKVVYVPMRVKLPIDIDHALSIMALHFGISKAHVLNHAINILFAEVVDSIGPDRLTLYEDKLELLQLHRLESQRDLTLEAHKEFEALEKQLKIDHTALAKDGGYTRIWKFKKQEEVGIDSSFGPVVDNPLHKLDDDARKEDASDGSVDGAAIKKGRRRRKKRVVDRTEWEPVTDFRNKE